MMRVSIGTAGLLVAAALAAASPANARDLDGLVREVLDKVCFPMGAGGVEAAVEAAEALGFTPDGEPPLVDGAFLQIGLSRAPYDLYIWRDDQMQGCSLDLPQGDVAALDVAVTAAMAEHHEYVPDLSGAVPPHRATWRGPAGSVWVAAFDFSPRVAMGVAMDRRSAPGAPQRSEVAVSPDD